MVKRDVEAGDRVIRFSVRDERETENFPCIFSLDRDVPKQRLETVSRPSRDRDINRDRDFMPAQYIGLTLTS